MYDIIFFFFLQLITLNNILTKRQILIINYYKSNCKNECLKLNL